MDSFSDSDLLYVQPSPVPDQPSSPSSKQPVAVPPKAPARKKLVQPPTLKGMKEKMISRLHHKMQHRKDFSKLTAYDISQWSNPAVSAIVFFTGHMLFYMLWKWELTLPLIIGRILVIQILICFAYFIGMKIVAPNREVPVPQHLNFSAEKINLFLAQFSEKIHSLLTWYVSILLCKDFRITLALALVIEIFNRFIGRYLTIMGLSYILFNGFFIAPLLYDTFEDEIHYLLDNIQDHLIKLFELAHVKLQKMIAKLATKEGSGSESQGSINQNNDNQGSISQGSVSSESKKDK